MKRLLIAVTLIAANVTSVGAQLRERPGGAVDSVVLERRPVPGGLACRDCPPARLVLHRSTVAEGALEQIAAEADSIGFYKLPSDLIGKVAFCEVVISDALMATITIHHRDAAHSVSGYHHCVRGKDGRASAEPQLLRHLEAHIHRRHANPFAPRDLSAASDSCSLYRNRPVFDFQVERPARFLTSTHTLPIPDPTIHQRQPHTADFALAQFVVDTMGYPVAGTLRMLMLPPALTADVVARALDGWRFEPATIRGCKVAQLMQTPLRWR